MRDFSSYANAKIDAAIADHRLAAFVETVGPFVTAQEIVAAAKK